MSVTLFENQSLVVGHTTSADGQFGLRVKHRTSTEELNIQMFLERLGTRELFVLYPRRSVITTPLDDIKGRIISAQGVISNISGFSGRVFAMPASDCPVLVMVNEKTGTIGLLHLGWWQIYTHLIRKFMKVWFANYQTPKSTIKVFIGPSICSQCFKLTGIKGWLRIALFRISPWREHIKKDASGYHLNLHGIILAQLRRYGITADQITMSSVCTYENPELSSYRREGRHRTSSNLVFVAIK